MPSHRGLSISDVVRKCILEGKKDWQQRRCFLHEVRDARREHQANVAQQKSVIGKVHLDGDDIIRKIMGIEPAPVQSIEETMIAEELTVTIRKQMRDAEVIAANDTKRGKLWSSQVDPQAFERHQRVVPGSSAQIRSWMAMDKASPKAPQKEQGREDGAQATLALCTVPPHLRSAPSSSAAANPAPSATAAKPAPLPTIAKPAGFAVIVKTPAIATPKLPQTPQRAENSSNATPLSRPVPSPLQPHSPKLLGELCPFHVDNNGTQYCYKPDCSKKHMCKAWWTSIKGHKDGTAFWLAAEGATHSRDAGRKVAHVRPSCAFEVKKTHASSGSKWAEGRLAGAS